MTKQFQNFGQFRIRCIAKEISQSKALEEAIAVWLSANPVPETMSE